MPRGRVNHSIGALETLAEESAKHSETELRKKIGEESSELIIDFIKKNSGKEVELTEKIDESIIGGAIINMGDKQLDTSVSSCLKALKLEFSKNLYIQDY